MARIEARRELQEIKPATAPPNSSNVRFILRAKFHRGGNDIIRRRRALIVYLQLHDASYYRHVITPRAIWRGVRKHIGHSIAKYLRQHSYSIDATAAICTPAGRDAIFMYHAVVAFSVSDELHKLLLGLWLALSFWSVRLARDASSWLSNEAASATGAYNIMWVADS